MATNGKLSCIGWLHDVRVKMNKDMEGMTAEERAAYIHAGAEEALNKMTKLSLEEARRQRRAILHPEKAKKATSPKVKVKAPAKPSTGRRKVGKRLAHA